MTGVCALLAGSGGTSVYNLTAGESTAYPQGGEINTWGYTSAVGSIDPPTFSPTGTSISLLAVFGTSGTPYSMTFTVIGTHTQGVFNSIKVGGDTYTSASAVFSTNGSASTWKWGVSTNYFPLTGTVYQVIIS